MLPRQDVTRQNVTRQNVTRQSVTRQNVTEPFMMVSLNSSTQEVLENIKTHKKQIFRRPRNFLILAPEPNLIMHLFPPVCSCISDVDR